MLVYHHRLKLILLLSHQTLFICIAKKFIIKLLICYDLKLYSIYFHFIHRSLNVVDCGSPPVPKNGTTELVSSNQTTFGSTAYQSCNTGFNISGKGTVKCLSSGHWSESSICNLIGNCTIQCNLFDLVLHLYCK